MRAPRHQAAGDAIRAIVQPGGDGDHTLARLLVDTISVVKRPRNGRNVDARFSSDILDFDWHRLSQAFPIMHGFLNACQRYGPQGPRFAENVSAGKARFLCADYKGVIDNLELKNLIDNDRSSMISSLLFRKRLR